MSPANRPEDYQMGLFDHLRELRKRLLISILSVAIGAGVAYTYSAEIFDFLCGPYAKAFPNIPLMGTSPAEAFILKLKVAVFAGAVLVAPILFHQLWLFVAPAMYENEKRYVIPFVFLSTVLFAVGSLFSYYGVLPFSFEFFHEQYRSIHLNPNIKIGECLSLTITLLIGFGSVFEMPLLAFFLTRIGVIDYKILIRYLRHATVVIFVLAAVLTPPDVLTQLLMAGPLMVLYLISIGISWLARLEIKP